MLLFFVFFCLVCTTDITVYYKFYTLTFKNLGNDMDQDVVLNRSIIVVQSLATLELKWMTPPPPPPI